MLTGSNTLPEPTAKGMDLGVSAETEDPVDFDSGLTWCNMGNRVLGYAGFVLPRSAQICLSPSNPNHALHLIHSQEHLEHGLGVVLGRNSTKWSN